MIFMVVLVAPIFLIVDQLNGRSAQWSISEAAGKASTQTADLSQVEHLHARYPTLLSSDAARLE
jgi:hypothetical protein